jgi:glycosyltransferase involved in cell wall biosynthesis
VSTLRGLHYISYHDHTGYGVAAERAMLALLDAGVPVTWTPLARHVGGASPTRDVSRADPRLAAIAYADVDYDVALVHTVPELYPEWRERLADVTLVGQTVWETSVLPRHWPALVTVVDAVVVPCRWNVEVFRAAGAERPITVVPHLPPPELGSVEPWPIDPSRFVFYTVGEWTTRKAIGRTVEAFVTAFTPTDPVELLVKTTARDMSGSAPAGGGRLAGTTAWSLASILGRYGQTANVRLVSVDLAVDDMARIHRRGQCFVSLGHGEGFGLGPFDAAAHGRPVITTGWGGSLDFLPAADSYLIDATLVPVVDPTGAQSYTPDQEWAEPSFDHAVELLRRVVADQTEAAARGARLADHVRAEFDAASSTSALIGALDRAVATRPSPSRQPR